MAHEPDSAEELDELFVPYDVASGELPADVGLSAPKFFPSPVATTADGLLCVGGRLAPEWLLDAYAHGIFPWPIWEQEPMVWWSLASAFVFMLLLVLSANLFADAVRDAFDPRLVVRTGVFGLFGGRKPRPA